LQEKRKEIRAALENAGHFVKYAEDLVDPALTGPTANPLIQELVLMSEYDLIVTLVGSPGSIVEATTISLKPKLAQKASLYLDSDHQNGLVGQACRNAQNLGAHFQTYNYPGDLVDCHLLTHVSERAKSIQLLKFLL